jgi:hypothetical protein
MGAKGQPHFGGFKQRTPPPHGLVCEVVSKPVRLGDGTELVARVKVYRPPPAPPELLAARSEAYQRWWSRSGGAMAGRHLGG